MITIPMYWLLIEALLGAAIALVLHEVIEKIRYKRRFEVVMLSEDEKNRIVEQLREKRKDQRCEGGG